MGTVHKLTEQRAFDETEIEDKALEEALEEREKVRLRRQKVNKDFTKADDAVKGKLAAHDLKEDEIVRCGAFRIVNKTVEGRSVAFEVEPSSRLTITRAPEAGAPAA